ncbi:MAG: hypothetical protein K6G03_04390, partial [Lachnospiraceae bacterium]|nr:hypothetical protein [Lachnospiraceae bacterium]
MNIIEIMKGKTSKIVALVIASAMLMTACGQAAKEESAAAPATEAAAPATESAEPAADTAEPATEATTATESVSEADAQTKDTETDPESLLLDGVVPLTWEPSAD